MYAKLAVLEKKEDEINGGAKSVTLGFFDEKGILQLQVPLISGKLFPKDIAKGKEVIFNYRGSTQKWGNRKEFPLFLPASTLQ